MSSAMADAHSRWLVPAMIVAVTLAVMPGGETPFSGVKTGLLLAAALALLLRAALLAPTSPARLSHRVLAGLWLGTLALSALLGPAARPGGLWLEAAAGLVLLSLLQAPTEPAPAQRAIAGAGTALALVAVIQAVGVDPFHWLGWSSDHPSARMRVYGTLGNPNFVAGYLGASLCLTLGEAFSASRAFARRAWWAAAALQAVALAPTRSWGSLLALGAAALTLIWTREPSRGARSLKRMGGLALLALSVAALLLLAVWGRPLSHVLAGRLYLWSVAAPHALEAPVFGHGPGSFETLWPAWEAEYWARGAPPEQERFVGLQDHAHLDYLEWLLELGLVGAIPRLLLLLAALRAGRHARTPRDRAVIAALMALAARALTDFPLARPAELCLFVVLMAVALRSDGTSGKVSGTLA